MKTKFIFSGTIWSLGSGWAEGSTIVKTQKVTITMVKADYAKAYDMAYKIWNKRKYPKAEIELKEIINI